MVTVTQTQKDSAGIDQRNADCLLMALASLSTDFVGISPLSLLQNCSLESYICVNVWAWSYICHSEQHPQMYIAFHRVQKSNVDMTECVCEYHPTVNLPLLQFKNSNAFQYVILKELK